MKGRAFAHGRLDPEAAAVHLDDLLSDRKPEAGTALGLGIGVVHLMELLEDAGLVLFGYSRTSVCDAHCKVPIRGHCRHAHLARISELDRVADQIGARDP
jgi:hypothetical protein